MRPTTRLVLLGSLLLWSLAVAGGLHALWVHAATPGAQGPAPAAWPADIGPSSSRPHLAVVLHPHCACSRATLAELGRILGRSAGAVDARVLFVRPPGASADWCHTALWQQAARLQGVRTVVDEGGAWARRLGAETSGHTLLFAADGRLLFSGGITAARAHEGDNTGKSVILAYVGAGEHPPPAATLPVTTPVFGCPLFDEG